MISRSIFRDLIILLSITGIAFAVSVFLFKKNDRDSVDSVISIEKERELGSKLVENYLANPSNKKVENSLIDSAILLIEERLLFNFQSEFQYEIFVFENSIVNAFAMPGGYILISTGMLEFAQSAEEIAAVIAHEMGHIENRHVLSRLSKEIVILLITGGDQTIMGEAAQVIGSTAFNRHQEREADEFSLQLLEKANIHPVNMSRLFRRLKEEGHGNYNNNLQIFSTHPHHNERIKAALEYEVKENFKPEPLNIDWDRVKNFRANSTISEEQ